MRTDDFSNRNCAEPRDRLIAFYRCVSPSSRGQKPSGSRRLLNVALGITAFIVLFMVGTLNTPELHAQSKTTTGPDTSPSAPPIAADATAVFEVVTIKPSQDDGVHLNLDPSGLFHPTGSTLAGLIKLAYDIQARQLVGGPAWLNRDKLDLYAKPDKPGKPSLPQLKLMLQKLLADRFKLVLHHEKRELPVYAITVAKSGPKLTRNEKDPNGDPSYSAGPRIIIMTNGTMADLASWMQRSGNILDRPIVDQTGLGSARYDFTVKWTPLTTQGQPGGGERGGDNADAPPDLFTAFQQQLGLKLEPTRAPVDVLVVDHVEKPSEN